MDGDIDSDEENGNGVVVHATFPHAVVLSPITTSSIRRIVTTTTMILIITMREDGSVPTRIVLYYL